MPDRYLTKSRFKVAYECPAKLYYNEQPKVYGNKNRDNEFLKALAHGGFQVGALAKIYYPGGVDLEGLRTEEAVARTEELLTLENATIFEAAILNGPFLVRVDILQKVGNRISLIEVKSSSYDPATDRFFKKRDPGIDSGWEPYLIDVSFQTWVASKRFPSWQISSFLMLADKSAKASVDGLHQMFRIASGDSKHAKIITKAGTSLETVGIPILRTVNVDAEVAYLMSEEVFPNGGRLDAFAEYLAENHLENKKALSRISSLCKSCEFRIGSETKAQGLKSGFEECWIESGKLKTEDLSRVLIFDIWNCHKTEQLLAADKTFFDQVKEEDLKPKTKPKGEKALEPYQRQWIQITKANSGDKTPYIDIAGIKELFHSIKYPVHCIDFETTTVAIPFHKGRRPYEQIAFQFSHHILEENGSIIHKDQFLEMRPGIFPNFGFVRALREVLAKDEGTIFRYASHENSVLRQIRGQLLDSSEEDRDDLINFIDLITKPRKGEEGEAGKRNMLDLREIVLEHYFHPLMGGSNSIKKVIPAVLQESKSLKEKYSRPIYGAKLEVASLNFDSMTWIEMNDRGVVQDPYKKLPAVFEDIPQSLFEGEAPLFQDDSIDDGGAAMTAWSRMQFTEMTELERESVTASLLKYCELDTLSMVWLLEYWRGLKQV